MTVTKLINHLCIEAETIGEKIFSEYLKHVEAYCSWQKVNGADPDEKLMRNVEEQIGISVNAKKAFREEIVIRMSVYNRKGKIFGYRSHERLHEAIEKVVLNHIKDGFSKRNSINELTKMVECTLNNLRNGDFEIAKASIQDITRFVSEMECAD